MDDRLKHAKFVSTILNASLKEKVKRNEISKERSDMKR